MIDDRLKTIRAGLDEVEDFWDDVKVSYKECRSILAGAGVPMSLDQGGRPTTNEGAPRDLADCIRDLVGRCKEAVRTAAQFAQAVPESCPITGRPYADIREHPEHGWLATYHDDERIRHTIPALSPADMDGPVVLPHDRPLRGLAYDPETEQWSAEAVPVRLIREDDLARLRDSDAARHAAEVECQLDEANRRLRMAKDRTAALVGSVKGLVRLCREQRGWWRRPIDRKVLRWVEEACDEATNEDGQPSGKDR